MLSPAEAKIVLSTLAKRRSWLRKTLENSGESDLPNHQRKEYIESMRLLDAAMKKIAATTPTSMPAKTKSNAPSSTRKPTMETARILIAEDNEDSANLLMGVLGDFGMKQVILVNDGIDAFDAIKAAKVPFDLILCDWDMPGLSGLEVHARAKASNTLKGAHFVMVTAVSESARIREAIQQGVNDYIVKPVDLDILENKIRAALGIDNNVPDNAENSV